MHETCAERTNWWVGLASCTLRYMTTLHMSYICDMGVGRTYSVNTWMGFPLKSFGIAISPGLLPFFVSKAVVVVLCIHAFGSTVRVLTRVLPGFLIKGWAGNVGCGCFLDYCHYIGR